MSTLIQRSFTGGELAPALYARADTSKYATGLRICKNGFIMRHGGWTNRPGTTFVGPQKLMFLQTRLIPFIFNSEQTYVLEFGFNYMRVIKNGSYIFKPSIAISNITQAQPAVVTTVAPHGLANGDEVYIVGVNGMVEINNNYYFVANVTATTFEIQHFSTQQNINSTGYTPYTSGGTIYPIYEITTPYASTDLPALKFVQSADVITLVHPSYAVRELKRLGTTNWTLTTKTFAPGIAAPVGVAVTGTPGTTSQWVVTAIASETLEESLPSAVVGNTDATPQTRNITWTAVPGAQEYNIYKAVNGVFGFLGVAQGTLFVDTSLTPDTTDTPPSARNPFANVNEYPSTVSYIQQRLAFANSNKFPEKTWLSRTGQFGNFTVSSPLQDDDAVTFTIAGRQVNAVKHLLDLGKLISFTTSGEWAIDGDSSGILRPTSVNPKQYSYNGSGDLRPIVIGGNALYVQARGSIVRDLGFDYQVDGYRGNDLTIFSAHLFEGHTLVDWDFQQIPHSVVWAVRSDGVVLGLTYVREHELLAWHRHDFGGVVENVCVVPEGDEDAVYFTILRGYNRYVERMSTRRVSDVKDSIFMDSTLSYDGENTDFNNFVTLTDGVTWDYTETLTLTANLPTFNANDVGNEIHLEPNPDYGYENSLIRFKITQYISPTVVKGKPHKTVPFILQGFATVFFGKAVDELIGLEHLEGQAVSVLGDGFVVANPNNDAYQQLYVSHGKVTLDKAYVKIHIGLPYMSDMETLDVESTQTETLADKKMIANVLTLQVESSRGIWAGAKPPTDDTQDPLEGLFELKIRNEENYDDPVALYTGKVDINLKAEWNSNGRIFVRQVDPLPLTVLAVAPNGKFPFRKAGT